jgi:hypothetical protein
VLGSHLVEASHLPLNSLIWVGYYIMLRLYVLICSWLCESAAVIYLSFFSSRFLPTLKVVVLCMNVACSWLSYDKRVLIACSPLVRSLLRTSRGQYSAYSSFVFICILDVFFFLKRILITLSPTWGNCSYFYTLWHASGPAYRMCGKEVSSLCSPPYPGAFLCLKLAMNHEGECDNITNMSNSAHAM